MNTDRVSSLFWLIVGLITMLGSLHLGLGSLHEPGSGFLAFLAGAFICGVALLIFLQSFIRWRGVSLNLAAHWEGLNWRRAVIIGLLILGFIVALEGLGFFLTSFFLLFLIFKWVERFSWGKSIFVPALTLTATYLVFNIFLKATLPRGVFGF